MSPHRRVVLAGALVLVLGLVTLAAVLGRDGTAPTAPSSIPGAHLGGTGPGALVSAQELPALAGHADAPPAARVVYRSTDGSTGRSTLVSGTVVVPPGTAPAGGWPVVSLGHATVGIDSACAPSLSPSLDGLVPLVTTFVDRGFAVAMTDYQGLGEPGVHPYLDARTAGLNLIDAVRALRATFPDVSRTWGAYGGSQGGGAAWAADELAARYAPELHLVGAAAISPAADVTPIVDAAVAGTLTADQEPAFVYLVESVARVYPQVRREDYRRGSVRENWKVLASCNPADLAARNRAVAAIRPAELAPASAAAAERLRLVLQRWALPQARAAAPLAVAYGGEDTFVDARWTDAALERACALGDQVVREFLPAQGHGEVDPRPAISWLAGRFAGAAVHDECPQGASSSPAG